MLIVCSAPDAALETVVRLTFSYSASVYPRPAVVMAVLNATVISPKNPSPLPPVKGTEV